jgi:hypothetical protein
MTQTKEERIDTLPLFVYTDHAQRLCWVFKIGVKEITEFPLNIKIFMPEKLVL